MTNDLFNIISTTIANDLSNKLKNIQLSEDKLYYKKINTIIYLSPDNILDYLIGYYCIPYYNLATQDINYCIINSIYYLKNSLIPIQNFQYPHHYTSDTELINAIINIIKTQYNNIIQSLCTNTGKCRNSIYYYNPIYYTKTLITSKNIVALLSNSCHNCFSPNKQAFDLFFKIISMNPHLEDISQFLESNFKAKLISNNPFNNLDCKFAIIDKNIYTYLNNYNVFHNKSLVSEELNYSALFPNFSRLEIIKAINLQRKYKLFNIINTKAFHENPIIYYNNCEIEYKDTKFFLKNITNHFTLIFKQNNFFNTYNIVNNTDYNITKFLGYLTNYNIETTAQLAKLKAYCGLNYPKKSPFFIIYSSKHKEFIKDTIVKLISNDCLTEISLRKINRKATLRNIENSNYNIVNMLLVSDESLPNITGFNTLINLVTNKTITIKDSIVKNIKINNTLPFVFVTDNIKNIDILNKKLEKNVTTINLDSIDADNLKQLLSNKETKNLIINWLNHYFLLYGTYLLYNRKPLFHLPKQKTEPLSTKSIINDFISNCCYTNISTDIEASELYKAFNLYFTNKYNLNTIKRTHFVTELKNMGYKYYRPHHNNNKNPYCFYSLALKPDYEVTINNIEKVVNSEITTKVKTYEEYINNLTIGINKLIVNTCENTLPLV